MLWSKVREETIIETILTLDVHENEAHRQLGLRVTPACGSILGLI